MPIDAPLLVPLVTATIKVCDSDTVCDDAENLTGGSLAGISRYDLLADELTTAPPVALMISIVNCSRFSGI